MDQCYTVKYVHEVLQKVKGKQSGLEGAVGVTTRNSKEEILKGLVELRAKGGEGVGGLLRWLEEAKCREPSSALRATERFEWRAQTGVKISELAQTASSLDLKDLAKALRG
eukprot:3938600-Rhodomonas_salina.1